METLAHVAPGAGQQWWAREQISPKLTRLWEPNVDPLLRCSVWHVRGSERDLLIDAGLGIASLRDSFPTLFDRELVVVATHSHHDHTGGMHEFEGVYLHELEAGGVTDPIQGGGASLLATEFDVAERDYLVRAGYEVPDVLITALPHEGYIPGDYLVQPAMVLGLIGEGDVLDLGDLRYRVLHVPGHTLGSIALLNTDGSELFSGDTLYDGPLLAELEESDPALYVESIVRIRSLTVSWTHPGHERSFGLRRKNELCDLFLGSR